MVRESERKVVAGLRIFYSHRFHGLSQISFDSLGGFEKSPHSSLAKRIFFRKHTRPPLPIREAPPFSPSLSSIVFATPSVPLVGDRNPQGREDVAGSAIAPPEFWSDSGACAHKGLAGSAYAIKLRLFDATELRVFYA